MSRAARFAILALVAAAACGGSKGPDARSSGSRPVHHPCGEEDKTHAYDLHDEDGQDHYAPCSKSGKEDLSGKVRLETNLEGVKVIIHVTDDDVNEGIHGADLKGRDAMIVYPKGRQAKGVEVPLKRVPHGYTGEKLIPFSELEKLTDEGTRLEVSIHDHDDDHPDGKHEELKVSIAISAGKSCEKAQDENPQQIVMGKKGERDLTAEQLGAPMKTSAFISGCGLSDSANADICVAVKQGKPLGVSVRVTPQDNKVAACIDKATRRLSFPKSDTLDVVKQHF
jgi:hypothetical protein